MNHSYSKEAAAIRACERSIWFYRNANASNEADTDEEEYDETQDPDLSSCESSFADAFSTNQEGCSDESDWDNLLGDD